MTGPYIVTTKRSGEAREADARRLESAGHTGEAFQLRHSDTVQSRRAVATLEEARAEATAICAAHGWPDTLVGECALPESGGTVGPLPDGTVIEVESVTWESLPGPQLDSNGTAHEFGPREKALRLDAFNARRAAVPS